MSLPEDPIRHFSETLGLTGVAHTGPEKTGQPGLIGKRLGLINGASWVIPWSNYFGRLYLPGVHLLNVGNEAVQINFIEAYEKGLPTPPQLNIDAFVRYARDLAELGHVDAILITCSTMNRSYPAVVDAMKNFTIPVIQIDRPMMERAVNYGGKVLVVATHGPTVESTQALLNETAKDLGQEIRFIGLDIEEAWHKLADGKVEDHNQVLADGIRSVLAQDKITCVVLAQLSMTLFLLSYPDPETEFGIPVLTSGKCGFEAVREILLKM